jgi:hypothetical protein
MHQAEDIPLHDNIHRWRLANNQCSIVHQRNEPSPSILDWRRIYKNLIKGNCKYIFACVQVYLKDSCVRTPPLMVDVSHPWACWAPFICHRTVESKARILVNGCRCALHYSLGCSRSASNLLGLMKRNDVLLKFDYKFLKSGPSPEFFDDWFTSQSH